MLSEYIKANDVIMCTASHLKLIIVVTIWHYCTPIWMQTALGSHKHFSENVLIILNSNMIQHVDLMQLSKLNGVSL